MAKRDDPGKFLKQNYFSTSTTTTTTTTTKNYNNILSPSILFPSGISLGTGIIILLGGYHMNDSSNKSTDTTSRLLLPRLPIRITTFCEDNNNELLTDIQRNLPKRLGRVLGPENVLEGNSNSVLCVITPTSLADVVTCVKLIVDADCVILPKGTNTSPDISTTTTTTTIRQQQEQQQEQQRPAVVISMKHLNSFFPIDGGRRVVCMAGTKLEDLSRNITSWFPNRESHYNSINDDKNTTTTTTTAGAVAMGSSSGTELRKGGHVTTDRAMYIKVLPNKFGEKVVEVVNTLGIKGIEDEDFHDSKGGINAVDQLDAYQRDVKEGYSRAMGVSSRSKYGTAMAHNSNYAQHLCCNDDDDTKSAIYADDYDYKDSSVECNRSEGKVLILATVHDTFERPIHTRSFWISFRDYETAMAFRKYVCFQQSKDIPISLEYMNRDTFDIIDQAGRIQAAILNFFMNDDNNGIVDNTSSPFKSLLWNIKLWIEDSGFDINNFFYQFNDTISPILPDHVMSAGKEMDHHVTMTIGEFKNGGNEIKTLLDRLRTFASKHGKEKIVIYECGNESEGRSIVAFRSVANSAFHTWCVGRGIDKGGSSMMSIKYNLPINNNIDKVDNNIPQLPPPSSTYSNKDPSILKRMRYSHLGSNTIYENLAFTEKCDTTYKAKFLKSIIENYRGKVLLTGSTTPNRNKALQKEERWKKMDPLNVFNPGIGDLSKNYRYRK